jgi:hypothetical protein
LFILGLSSSHGEVPLHAQGTSLEHKKEPAPGSGYEVEVAQGVAVPLVKCNFVMKKFDVQFNYGVEENIPLFKVGFRFPSFQAFLFGLFL